MLGLGSSQASDPSFCLKLWLVCSSCLTARWCDRDSLTKLALNIAAAVSFLILPYFADHTAAISPSPAPPPTALFITFLSFSLHTLYLSRETPTASRQARTELRRLKQEVRNKHAVTVIWAYWQGTKVFQPQLWCLLSRCLVVPVHRVPLLSQNPQLNSVAAPLNETFYNQMA